MQNRIPRTATARSACHGTAHAGACGRPGRGKGRRNPAGSGPGGDVSGLRGPGAEQVRLARKALEISPDCADAYVLLAEHAQTAEEARKLYEQGVAAGERALGKQAFEEYAGHFWGILETRPYMRAREGLAQCLWEAGRREEAAEHYQEMLRLNPNDNQGVRYSLATLLLDMDRDEDLRRLLAEYEDDASAEWAYTRALLAFREGGESAQANKLLTQAMKVNKHVPAYLLGHKQLPRRPAAVHQHGRGGRGRQLRGRQSPRLAQYAGGHLVVAEDARRAVAQGTQAPAAFVARTQARAAAIAAGARRSLAGRCHAEPGSRREPGREGLPGRS